MNRFFVAPENIGDRDIIIDEKETVHHISKVLRLGEGDRIEISDGVSWEYEAEICYADLTEVRAVILDKQSFTAEPEIRITLFQGIPKQEKMELIIQKCVELGVNRIVPVFMSRTVVVDKGNFGKKLQRWQKVSAEAVKQCKRGIVPEISEALKMEQAVEELKRHPVVIFPYENEEGTTIKDMMREIKAPPEEVAVIIGPEGGFSDKEADAILKAGGRSVSLGRTTLRTETAGMAAVAMIMYEWEL